MHEMNRAPGRQKRRPGRKGGVAAFAAALSVLLVAAPSALADPAWQIKSSHAPQHLVPGGTGTFVIVPKNVGDMDSAGTGTIRVELPAGVVATAADARDDRVGFYTCTGLTTSTLECTFADPIAAPAAPAALRGAGPPLFVSVEVDPGASGTADTTVTIADGGAADAATDVDRTPISTTPAGFGFIPGTFAADAFDAPSPLGAPVRQASSHPFEVRVDFETNLTQVTHPTYGDYTEPDGRIKSLQVKMPDGFIGNPEATPKCTGAQLLDSGPANAGACPPATQVGTIDLMLNSYEKLIGYNADVNGAQDLPVWNMVPAQGAIASFAFQILANPVYINITLDPADYSIVATLDDVNATLPVRSASLALWGVPADPAHDALRLNPRGDTGVNAYGISANYPLKPFLTLPSECGVDGMTTMRANSWADPGTWTPTESSAAAQATGCDDVRVDFRPTLTMRPESTQPNTPTAVTVELTVPQKDDTVLDPANAGQLYTQSNHNKAIATPSLKDVRVVLPEGMTVSPSSAGGLAACTPAQIKLGSNDAPTCAEASKIGSVQVETPLLPAPLRGGIYFAAQNDNPFNSMLALYLVAEGSNVMLKLPGKIAPDPATGQLTATFDNNPKLPFSKLTLRFKGGPRAPLVTPPTCGVKRVDSTITSWNGAVEPVASSDQFTIDGNCDLGFDPSFTGGTDNPVAGHDSPVTVRFGRGDRDEELSNIDVAMPDGLLGRIASLDLCDDAKAAAGTCGEGSRVGKVTVGAGPGTNPYFLGGQVFMTGPYKGAPFGFSIVVPAKAGPIDLGLVVVRAAVHVDRTTAKLRVTSDPLPRILQGIPLHIRMVDVAIDRAGFTFNPTSCKASSVAAQIASVAGKLVGKSARFQVAGCAALPFQPKMTIRMGAKGRTKADITAPLDVSLAMTPGQANNKSVSVALPRNVNARLEVINQRACTLAQFTSRTCPSANRIGTSTAVTPLLKEPLTGDVFFVRNPARRLPDLMVALRGQVDIDLTGKVTVNRDFTLRTDFDTIPDVPITKFSLRLVAGKNGPVGFVAAACTKAARAERATIRFRSHSGKAIAVKQKMTIVGCRATARKVAKKK